MFFLLKFILLSFLSGTLWFAAKDTMIGGLFGLIFIACLSITCLKIYADVTTG